MFVPKVIATIFSSPELKAQVSFSDHLSSVVGLSVCQSVCLSVCAPVSDFYTGDISSAFCLLDWNSISVLMVNVLIQEFRRRIHVDTKVQKCDFTVKKVGLEGTYFFPP